MKIAHVLGTFDRTGITTVVVQLSNTMANLGHDIDIIIWDGIAPASLANNINVIKINVFGLSRRPLLGKFFRKLHKRLLTDVLYHFLYSYIFSNYLEIKLEKKKYNQIFFHGMRYYPFFRITIPHVVVAHSIKSLSLLNSKSILKNRLIKHCLKIIYHDKTILTVSKGVREDLINNFSADENKTFCVNNPFNIKDIRKKSSEFQPILKPANGYILAVGRNSKQKRFDILLNAYSLSKIKEDLVIIGSNQKHFSKLKKLASSLQMSHKIHFIDHLDNPFPYFKHAKVLVVTSEYEGFGNTIVESLICGVPVVSTDCMSGPREILIGDHHKYLSKINNPEDIAEKVKNCLIDKPVIDSLLLNRFDDTVIANKYLEHITN